MTSFILLIVAFLQPAQAFEPWQRTTAFPEPVQTAILEHLKVKDGAKWQAHGFSLDSETGTAWVVRVNLQPRARSKKSRVETLVGTSDHSVVHAPPQFIRPFTQIQRTLPGFEHPIDDLSIERITLPTLHFQEDKPVLRVTFSDVYDGHVEVTETGAHPTLRPKPHLLDKLRASRLAHRLLNDPSFAPREGCTTPPSPGPNRWTGLHGWAWENDHIQVRVHPNGVMTIRDGCQNLLDAQLFPGLKEVPYAWSAEVVDAVLAKEGFADARQASRRGHFTRETEACWRYPLELAEGRSFTSLLCKNGRLTIQNQTQDVVWTGNILTRVDVDALFAEPVSRGVHRCREGSTAWIAWTYLGGPQPAGDMLTQSVQLIVDGHRVGHQVWTARRQTVNEPFEVQPVKQARVLSGSEAVRLKFRVDGEEQIRQVKWRCESGSRMPLP